MTSITVCIPVYRTGPDLRLTLASVQAQSHSDFRVEIAIEPTGLDAIDPQIRHDFETDPRFRFHENPNVLGWAGNVAALVARVRTDRLAILPHDDLWHPDYLARLGAALDRHPDAAVAYCDVRRFGSDSLLRVIDFDNTDIGTRLYSYYLQGAEAHAWRGLIRTARLGAGYRFPENPFLSFAVECEFVQRLLCAGAAIRVPGEFYRKRGYPKDGASVSRRWLHELTADQQRAALGHHRGAMLAGLPTNAPGTVDHATIRCAAEIAMLRRGLIFAPINPVVAEDMRDGLAALRTRVATIADPGRRGALAELLEDVARLIPRPAPPR